MCWPPVLGLYQDSTPSTTMVLRDSTYGEGVLSHGTQNFHGYCSTELGLSSRVFIYLTRMPNTIVVGLRWVFLAEFFEAINYRDNLSQSRMH